MVIASNGGVLAQEATPVPDVPGAELCMVAAPSFEQLNAAIGTLADGTPVAARTPDVVPAGTPADVATAAAVTATIRELIACYNAGTPLRAFGLFTDSYLHRLFARQSGFSKAAYDSYATPEPDPDISRHTAILDIEDIRIAGDQTGADQRDDGGNEWKDDHAGQYSDPQPTSAGLSGSLYDRAFQRLGRFAEIPRYSD